MLNTKHYSADMMPHAAGSGLNKSSGRHIDLNRVVSAGFAGLAGGAAITVAIFGNAGIAAALAGSLVGAAITGSAEYRKEKRAKAAQ